MRKGYVYIMASRKRTTLYVGVTNSIKRRVLEHKTGKGSKFSSRYCATCLVYYEECDSIVKAIAREKQLKRWHREWKLELIKERNPEFHDLAVDWYTEEQLSRD